MSSNIDISSLKDLLFNDLQDPFSKDCFVSLDIHIGKYNFCADAAYVNGNRSGQDHITGYNAQDLFEKLKIYMESMNDQK